MKNLMKKILVLLMASVLVIPVLAACGEGKNDDENKNTQIEKVDYVSQLKLDMTTNTKKLKVDVYQFIDGDTTHFKAAAGESDPDLTVTIIKARYLAVNTPESTGVIDKWGKTASNFTHETLDKAEAIMVESDDNQWNIDSTSSRRILLWVWYVPEGKAVTAENYRNLNVELLQEGYGRASNTEGNRYGEIASKALYQATQLKLRVFGNENDPNYFGGGDATPLDLPYLRTHFEDYIDHPVSVSGVVTAKFASSVYIERNYTVKNADGEDEEVPFGMVVYFGYKTGKILDILSVGNEVNVVGTVNKFEGTYGTNYQISDVQVNTVNPNSPKNTKLISTGNPIPYTETSVLDIMGKGTRPITVSFEAKNDDEDEEVVTIDYGRAVMNTSVMLKDLTVNRISTTTNPDSSSIGAMSLYCQDADGNEITLRTEVLYKEDGKTLYTEADVWNELGEDHVLHSVKGIVDEFSNEFQIAVYRWNCFQWDETVGNE